MNPALGTRVRLPATGRLRRRRLEFAARALRSLNLRLPGLLRLFEDKDGESRGYVLHRGYRLPPANMRGKMCGDAFRNERFYFLSAVIEAIRFSERLGGTGDPRIVDIGCGLGRLATGMLAELGEVRYLGIDANREFVRWCQDHIESQHPNYRFVHLDMANDLYNPAGTITGNDLRLPVDDASADVVNLWGVFTNMVPGHVQAYVAEIGRILRPGGRCFLTACVEDDVPDVTINPEGYVPYACDTPLTVVRYSRQWLFAVFRQHGLQLDEFRYHGSMFPKQSEIYLAKAALPSSSRNAAA